MRKHGEQVSRITPADPETAMRHMLDGRIVDAGDPERSVLLMKPTEQVQHGGGQKMAVGDGTYKRFRRFLDDRAATDAGKYRAAAGLPKPADEASEVSDAWLKLTGVPKHP